MISYIKCKNVEYNSKREESFYDISLPVRNNSTIIESFEEYIKPDLLEGDNKFDAGEYGLQERVPEYFRRRHFFKGQDFCTKFGL